MSMKTTLQLKILWLCSALRYFLHISQDVCEVRITDNKDVQTIYGHRTNLLNDKLAMWYENLFTKLGNRECFGFLL